MNDTALVPDRRRTVLRWAVGLVAGVVTIWVLVAAVGGLADATDALTRMNPIMLIPALGFEAASYVLLGIKLRDPIGTDVIATTEGIEIRLVVSGLGRLTPASPAEGLAAAARHLRAHGVPGRRGATPVAIDAREHQSGADDALRHEQVGDAMPRGRATSRCQAMERNSSRNGASIPSTR